MTTHIDLAIQKIEKDFEKLSNLVLEQLRLLQELLGWEEADGNEKILKKLFANEKLIDKYEVQLDEKIVKVIVLYHPLASDLRRMFAIYHMTINLERVGDLVVKITETFTEINDAELRKQSVSTLQNMLKVTSKMVNKALLSFINRDMEFANWTMQADMEFDEHHKKLLKKSIKAAGLPKESQQILNNLVEVRSIISSMERIGDHATNIAESTVYALTGSVVRHQNPKTEN